MEDDKPFSMQQPETETIKLMPYNNFSEDTNQQAQFALLKALKNLKQVAVMNSSIILIVLTVNSCINPDGPQ